MRQRFIINLGLLLSGLMMVSSGLLIQVKYHMGHHGDIAINDTIAGISYYGWSDLHKISVVVLSAFMTFHIAVHWKWYKAVITKKLIAKNKQLITLSVVFFMVAISGFTPWFIHLLQGNEMLRKTFIEIHDKLAIVLFIYLILHIIKKLKWFVTTLDKLTNKTTLSNQGYVVERPDKKSE